MLGFFRKVDVIYYLILGITALNFSMLSFDFHGHPYPEQKYQMIAYMRLPISWIGVFYMASVNPAGLTRFFSNYTAIVLLLMVLPLTLVFSVDMLDTAIYSIWFVGVILFLILYVDYNCANLDQSLAVILVIRPLAFLFGFFVLLALFRIVDYRIGRPFPAYFTTHTLVAMSAPVFLGASAIIVLNRKGGFVSSNWSYLLIGFSVLLVAVSGKRASILSVLIIVLVFILARRGSYAKLGFLVLIGFVVYLPLSFTDLSDKVSKATEYSRFRIEKSFDEKRSTSINARKSIWGRAFDLSKEYPLGVGLNNGSKLVGGGLHNTYLGYLLETGLLGFLAILGVIFTTLRKAYKTSCTQKKQVVYFIMVPTLLYYLTEYNTAPGQLFFLPFWIGVIFVLSPELRTSIAAIKR